MDKQVVDQLKKLNQNIERYLRMIDPALHPERDYHIKGILELKPGSKYIMNFEDHITEKDAIPIIEQMREHLKIDDSTLVFYLGGEVLKDIEVKDESES